MKRDAFLERLSKRSKARYGVEVTLPALRSWVAEGFFPGVQPGTHEWTRQSYRAALHVCRLRSRKIRLADETRLHLWLRGEDIPLYLLRGSVCEVLRHFRNVLKRQTSSAFDASRARPVSGQTARGFEIGAAKAALEIVPPNFKWTGEELRRAYALLNFGIQAKGEPQFESRLLKELGLDDDRIRAHLPNFSDMFSKVLADPSESEGALEQRIQSADANQFASARGNFRIVQFLPLRYLDGLPPELSSQLQTFVDLVRVVRAILRANPRWASNVFLLLLNAEIHGATAKSISA